MADETVADVLDVLPDDPDTRPLRDHLQGALSAEHLDYEDWVQPLKLTGGRVCLEFDDSELPGVLYVSRLPSGHLAAHSTVTGERYAVDPYMTVRLMRAEQVDVTPVLRADTPFAEGADD